MSLIKTTFLCFTFLLIACREPGLDSDAGGDPVPSLAAPTQGETAVSTTPSDPSTPATVPSTQPDAGGTADATAVSQPSPTAAPAALKEITICMAAAPQDLYLYGDSSPAAVAVRHALYESPVTTIGYAYQAQALEKLPTFSDKDLLIQPVSVETGNRVLDSSGDVVTLDVGVSIINAAGEEVLFDGNPVEMLQMAADFTFQPLVWSDGTAVTAEDSLFSFQVAASPSTPVSKTLIQRTANYAATGDLSLRWTGIPGFIDADYSSFVWSPLPRHQLGQVAIESLYGLEETSRFPLSSGPYIIAAWAAEDEILLTRNPHYYRAAEGLPRIDKITLRFGADNQWLTTSGCDVVTGDALTINDLPIIEGGSEWVLHSQPGSVFEHIDFGINPAADYAENQPDWFEDVRVRQAITLCTDRQRMVDELTAGQAEIMHAYVPKSHPLYSEDVTEWAYDPAAGNALLDEAGFQDFAGNGRRQDLTSGVPFTVTLGTNSESQLRLQINEMFKENMQACGIAVELYDRSAGTWYADGPVGPLFGRRFDLAEFAWFSRIQPDCALFTSGSISGPAVLGLGGWRGANVTGWSDAEYDGYCNGALTAVPGQPEYAANHQAALSRFSQELPILPLFSSVRLTAVHPRMQNIQLDSSQPSLLWNVAEWDVEE